MRKHKWKHLIKHNKYEGPFPPFYCLNCGKFASSASVQSFNVECVKNEKTI